MNFSRIIVIISILSVLIYTGIVLYFQYLGIPEYVYLTPGVFAFFGAELLALAKMYHTRKKNERLDTYQNQPEGGNQ